MTNNLPSLYKFDGPGGSPFEEQKYKKESLRADLCELANKISFQHGPRIVDAIMAKYDLTRRF